MIPSFAVAGDGRSGDGKGANRPGRIGRGPDRPTRPPLGPEAKDTEREGDWQSARSTENCNRQSTRLSCFERAIAQEKPFGMPDSQERFIKPPATGGTGKFYRVKRVTLLVLGGFDQFLPVHDEGEGAADSRIGGTIDEVAVALA